jgi:hypothetical protein
MSERVNKFFEFACANPDYWELMRQTHEPPEVAELDSRRREAFNAARNEVQRQCYALLDETHSKMKAKAAGTAMEAAFEKGFKRRSYEKGDFLFEVLSGRSKATYARINIGNVPGGRISLWCGLAGSAARLPKIQESFRACGAEDRLQIDGLWAWIEEPIVLGDAMSDIASRLVDAFWPGVLAYSTAMSNVPTPAVAGGSDDEE